MKRSFLLSSLLAVSLILGTPLSTPASANAAVIAAAAASSSAAAASAASAAAAAGSAAGSSQCGTELLLKQDVRLATVNFSFTQDGWLYETKTKPNQNLQQYMRSAFSDVKIRCIYMNFYSQRAYVLWTPK